MVTFNDFMRRTLININLSKILLNLGLVIILNNFPKLSLLARIINGFSPQRLWVDQKLISRLGMGFWLERHVEFARIDLHNRFLSFVVLRPRNVTILFNLDLSSDSVIMGFFKMLATAY